MKKLHTPRLTATLLVFFIALTRAWGQQTDFIGYYNGSEREIQGVVDYA